MRPEDWPAVARIYEQGLDLGTFEDTVPPWEEWDASHLATGRLVARTECAVVGWAALGPVSPRECYRGVVENSVYVAPEARAPRRGRALDDPGGDLRGQRGVDRPARSVRLPAGRPA